VIGDRNQRVRQLPDHPERPRALGESERLFEMRQQVLGSEFAVAFEYRSDRPFRAGHRLVGHDGVRRLRILFRVLTVGAARN